MLHITTVFRMYGIQIGTVLNVHLMEFSCLLAGKTSLLAGKTSHLEVALRERDGFDLPNS